ncbi:maleylpyruvate isomerase N-terminal domain-containing protein [Actinospica durhamensis]|uniref:Maleylpyruvate isomerase N-terminal domain-containing protein n=1 Tax=Actinospica durhamensis TaxID=1508375 RepID=A0A941ILS5_9ACTN|nr:maleylpyruvate isomerase N-terminal domain-containing protein [Actinospica durhamensis]MBR7833340.1 maleylpyruvate isomerase N-terminal domain-containing protein [Actinospica durhamensis]
MRRDQILGAFSTEAERLTAELDRSAGSSAERWSLPTACTPWTVRELLGHIAVTVTWLPGMLAEQAPAHATVGAAEYYRPDPRFSPETNNRRIELAREYSAQAESGAGVLALFAQQWRRVADLCAAEPQDRVVRTRHGDPMLLDDFLVTRVVEVGVHGMDLAAALGSDPWLTHEAADVITTLLAGEDAAAQLAALAWEPAFFIAKVTGRIPMTEQDRTQLERIGIRWLALG